MTGKPVRWERGDDGIVVVTLDEPGRSANTMNDRFTAAFGECVDALVADRENLIKAADPVFQPHTFGNKGQVMDGWETRRRREPGSDSAIVRLGCPGVVREVGPSAQLFKPGEEMVVKAKPARYQVKARALKGLIELIK